MPYFKNYCMSEIQGIDIIRWQNDLMKGSNNKGKGYAPTYLRTMNTSSPPFSTTPHVTTGSISTPRCAP